MYSLFCLIFKSSRLFGALSESFLLLLLLKTHLWVVFLIIIRLSFKFKAIEDGIALILKSDLEGSLRGWGLLARQLQSVVDA